MEYKDVKNLKDLKNFILYGDTNKVPMSLLENDLTVQELVSFNREQITKADIAATVTWLINQNFELVKKE
jgi:hypothetical protein